MFRRSRRNETAFWDNEAQYIGRGKRHNRHKRIGDEQEDLTELYFDREDERTSDDRESNVSRS